MGGAGRDGCDRGVVYVVLGYKYNDHVIHRYRREPMVSGCRVPSFPCLHGRGDLDQELFNLDLELLDLFRELRLVIGSHRAGDD